MSDHDDMMNDYDWHQNTGELPEYFEDAESDDRSHQSNYSQTDGGYMAGCFLVVAIIIVIGFLVWLI
jgi:hypothetical protein